MKENQGKQTEANDVEMTDAAVETASKIHLLEDVKLIERIKLQKIEIQRYLIDKIDKLEEDYLEMTLTSDSNEVDWFEATKMAILGTSRLSRQQNQLFRHVREAHNFDAHDQKFPL